MNGSKGSQHEDVVTSNDVEKRIRIRRAIRAVVESMEIGGGKIYMKLKHRSVRFVLE